MSQLLNVSLNQIARGAGIAVIGTIIGLLLQFICRMLITRIGTEADYGTFYLSMSILTVAVALGSLGLQEGTTRYVAYLQGRNDHSKTARIITISLQLSLVAGLILGVALFFLASFLDNEIFHSSELTLPIQLFSLSIPFIIMLNILASIFRGFGRILPQIYAQSIQSLLFLIILLIILFLSLSFVSVIFAYLAAVILSTIGLAIYSYRILPRLINNISSKTDPLLTKELLLFSLPLLGITVLSILTLYADTILLGFFKSPAEVGLYNAAYPLANFITVPYTAFLLIYTPVASKLFSRNKLDEMRRNHIISAKWITSITIPLFLLLLLYPDILIGSLFGGAYISSAPILRILAIGFIVIILCICNSCK